MTDVPDRHDGRVTARPRWLLPAAALWIVAPAFTAWSPSSPSAAVPLLGCLLWAAAVVALVVGAALSRLLPVPAMVAVGAVGALVAAYPANWAGLEPRSYFAAHRVAFGQVGGWVDGGGLTTADADGPGASVPLPWRPLAAGPARVVGRAGDLPAVLLTQAGTGGDASGYVYLQGDPPPGLVLDLDGRRVPIFDGLYLGDGWWWI